jgi:predicted metalloprotease with PDZ domain
MRVDEEEDTEECVVMLYWQCGESLGLRINNDSNGVTFVKEGGPASRADIRLGDVLVVVGLRSVSGYGSAAQLLNHLLANKRFQSTTICLKRVGSADACASSSYTGDVGDEEEGEEEGVEDQQEQRRGAEKETNPNPTNNTPTPPHHPMPTPTPLSCGRLL